MNRTVADVNYCELSNVNILTFKRNTDRVIVEVKEFVCKRVLSNNEVLSNSAATTVEHVAQILCFCSTTLKCSSIVYSCRLRIVMELSSGQLESMSELFGG